MIYNPYTVVHQSCNYDPYKIDNTTTSGYIVQTYNANNTNGIFPNY
jgi:hypothetical protein